MMCYPLLPASLTREALHRSSEDVANMRATYYVCHIYAECIIAIRAQHRHSRTLLDLQFETIIDLANPEI